VNIVLTRDPFFLAKDVLVAHSIDDAMAIAHDNQEVEVFIIGGGEIYEQSMKYWDRIYITVVDVTLEGDAFFPALNEQEWELVSEKQHQADEKNDYDYCFQVFERIAGQSSDS
ncbi:MAG: dihydrofolate reductase, partial [Bacteroidota bacterium]